MLDQALQSIKPGTVARGDSIPSENSIDYFADASRHFVLIAHR
jgi:hypothetical protein